jgi:hypothetical protein
MRLRQRLLLAALLAATACRPAARPAAPAVPAAVQTDAQAAAIVAARDVDARTLRATFKLVVHRADGSEEATRGAVVVAPPDRLRLQIFSFGVVTAYDYTANGDRYRIREPLSGGQRIGRFGDADADEGGALGDDLRPLFLTTAPSGSATVRDGGDRYLVTVQSARGRRVVEVAKRSGEIVRETVFVREVPELIIDYGDFRDVDGVSMPFAIDVSVPGRRGALSIVVTRYERNAPVDGALFEF